MAIARVINDYGEKYSPYMGGLVNHMPMGQMALYKMTGDLEKVKVYSEKFIGMYEIDEVKAEYPRTGSLGECLGKRELYESCLDLVRDRMEKEGRDSLFREVLNSYRLGMSSGLFHTLIRLAYADEGCELDPELSAEAARALAYYVTAYREAGVFKRKIQADQIVEEMEKLCRGGAVQKAASEKRSLGQRMKALYEDEEYMNSGFIVDGSADEKMKAVLDLAVRGYLGSGSIVALHCITGLHALAVLKRHYEDFDAAVDILTTCIITHLIAGDVADYGSPEGGTPLPWEEIKAEGSESLDVHAIKLTYSASELDMMYGTEGLKAAALKRIRGV